MSTNVIVMGLPANAVFPKLIFSFKGLFKKISIRKFWIRELSAVYGADYKQMTVEFTSYSEARKARTFLNNLPFVYGNMEYHLQADLADNSDNAMQYERSDRGEQRSRGRRTGKRERPRSRSPRYSEEASKLDMEIELLRKQRQVIEEERRLLLEQKKLEMIREYGPSAEREFEDFESYEPPRKRRRPEPVQAKKPRQNSPPPKHKPAKTRFKGLPVFFQPCKKLIADMKPYIEKDTTPEEIGILVKLIRAALRKKLAIALEGKDYMPTGEILKLYREKHPQGEDEAFVAKILANIRASFLTEPKVEKDEVDAVKVKKETAEGDAKDKEKVAEGEEVAKDDIPQETPANGENVTDAADPASGVNVKSEPDVSQDLENGTAGNLSAEVNADVVEIKTNSMINNTVVVEETDTENNALGDVEMQAEADAADPAIVVNVNSEPDVSQDLENGTAGNLSAEVNADVVEIKTTSMINNTVVVQDTVAENNMFGDVETQAEDDANWVDEQ